jgi:hypothetical protein
VIARVTVAAHAETLTGWLVGGRHDGTRRSGLHIEQAFLKFGGDPVFALVDLDALHTPHR